MIGEVVALSVICYRYNSHLEQTGLNYYYCLSLLFIFLLSLFVADSYCLFLLSFLLFFDFQNSMYRFKFL